MLRPVLLAAVIALAFSILPSRAETPPRPFLHELFTDNMVIQRNAPAPVWGWTNPGEKVSVRLDPAPPDARNTHMMATAGADGKWMVKLGPLPAGGPFSLVVTGPQTVILHNILIGDVWICSGQSNMEMGIGNVMNAKDEIAQANYPRIRLYTVPKRVSIQPESSLTREWEICTPQTVSANGWGGFTAAGYFFGRDLFRDLHVPIGLIHSSWGGTVAEAWTSSEALQAMPDFRPALEQVHEAAANSGSATYSYARALDEWWKKNDPGSAAGWQTPTLDTAAWQTMNLPQLWEGAGLPDFDGVVWFRKEIDLPADWTGKDLVLHLGPIDDRDTTYVNGTQVGGLDAFNLSRDYKVPAGVFKAGRNVIAVRVLDTGGGGGIYGKPDDMRLELPGAAAPLSLAGPWEYRVGVSLAKASPLPAQIGDNPNVVTVLYNGMIAPLIPFAIKGAIWYQGESNVGRDMQYRTLLPTMIRDWRSRFGVGEFPFLIVQIANFMATNPQPVESGWAALREAHRLTVLHTPKTGLATTIDIGEAADIHPKNKQEVGRRLALAAEAIAYGQKVEFSGPLYRAMKVDGNSVRLDFDHAVGLAAHGGDKLTGFAISGPDHHWAWANARIDGSSVVVSSPDVPHPTAVRYAWADNPIANLYNGAGLPAVPFSTEK